MEFNLQRILKALLFSSSTPLTVKDIQAVITRYHKLPASSREEMLLDEIEEQDIMEDIVKQVPALVTATQIRDAMDAMEEDMVEKKEVYRLVEGPTGYRLSISPDFADWVRLLRDDPKPQKFSQAAMETLAIVAYRQPVTRSEIESIRGVSSDSSINTLLEHELVLVTGRADLPGRPLQYETCDKFLEYCGLSSIEELPASDVLSPQQINEWIRESSKREAEALSDADVGLPESDKV